MSEAGKAWIVRTGPFHDVEDGIRVCATLARAEIEVGLLRNAATDWSEERMLTGIGSYWYSTDLYRWVSIREEPLLF